MKEKKTTGPTRGPWHVRVGEVNTRIQNQDNPTFPVTIATVYSREPNGNARLPDEANAHLMASAPDLYNLCCGILECLDAGDKITSSSRKALANNLRAAIKKATGQS